jgi:hypothetical protein
MHIIFIAIALVEGFQVAVLGNCIAKKSCKIPFWCAKINIEKAALKSSIM